MKKRLLLPLLLGLLLGCALPFGSVPERPVEVSQTDVSAPTATPAVEVLTLEGKGTTQPEEAPIKVPETPPPSEAPLPSETPTPPPSEAPRFYEKFAHGETVLTEDCYRTETVAIFLSHVEDASKTYVKGPLVYHVADIYLADATTLRSAFTHEDFRYKYIAPMRELAASNNAVLAISGDYIRHRKLGLCARNGVVYRDTPDPKRDVAAMYRDGTMAVFDATDTPAGELTADPNVWHLIGFGPSLLDAEGQPKTAFHTDVAGINPRAAIGYYEPGHYCFVLVEGRQDKYSLGLTMEGLSKLMASLGCKSAFNLDGGNTASMYFNGTLVNSDRTAPREVHDIFYIPLQTDGGAQDAPAETDDPQKSGAPLP